jgi:hypothetical protein
VRDRLPATLTAAENMQINAVFAALFDACAGSPDTACFSF